MSPKTRERIFAVVAELNYRPSIIAQGLRVQKTKTVALLVVDIANPFYPAVARAANDCLSNSGYVQLIGNTDGKESLERALLTDVVARGVDGIIMHLMAISAAEIREIVGDDMPVVTIGGEEGDSNADQVASDDKLGIAEGVKYLEGQGCDQLTFISGPVGIPPGKQRLAAFDEAIHDRGLRFNEQWIEHGSFTREGGYLAAIRLLSQSNRPQAVMCANDLIAIGAIEAAHALGLNVPQDVAIIGFDDIDTADLMSPKLTTIQNPTRLVGTACVTTLLRRIEGGKELPHQRTVLPTQLILRESA